MILFYFIIELLMLIGIILIIFGIPTVFKTVFNWIIDAILDYIDNLKN